ncbi:hypothetical protein ACJJTC_004992 [Scirpophaga incertulas]
MSSKMTPTVSGQSAQTGAQNVKRAPRSLREKVLNKTSATKAKSEIITSTGVEETSVNPVPPPRRKSKTPPATQNQQLPQPSEGSVSDGSILQPLSALAKIREWDCEELHPRPIDSEDEYDTDSSYCGKPARSTRQSMLAMPSKSGRSAGVEMDMATKLANEMWQKGKEALETAGNIKKECRATAIECLQTLYETTLALSDSRSRHKYNLERESKRHAQELIRVERAYNRTITDLTTKLASAIESQHKKAEETFQLTKNIDDWLRFETREPQEKIGEICTRISTIGNSLRNIETTLDNMQKAPVSSMPDTSTDIILAKIQTLQMVIDTLRKDIQNNLTHLEQTQKNFSNTQETATNTQLLVGQIWERLDSNITSPNNELVSETKALRDDMSQITELLEVGTAGGNAAINKQIVQELKPVCEMLEAVRSELKTMREDKRTPTSPPPVSLAVELAASSAPQAASKQVRRRRSIVSSR